MIPTWCACGLKLVGQRTRALKGDQSTALGEVDKECRPGDEVGGP